MRTYRVVQKPRQASGKRYPRCNVMRAMGSAKVNVIPSKVAYRTIRMHEDAEPRLGTPSQTQTWQRG